MKSVCEQDDRRFALAGWKFQFSNNLYSRNKDVNFSKINWAEVESAFDLGEEPEIVAKKYAEQES